MQIDEILETCLYVNNIELAEKFYTRVFHVKTYAKEDNRHVFFRIGKNMLLLFNAEETIKSNLLPAHGANGPGHIAFKVSYKKLDFWRQHLTECGVKIELEHEWPSGGQSVYFRDPFNNSLELATEDTWL